MKNVSTEIYTDILLTKPYTFFSGLAWVLTREQNPPQAAIDAAIAVLQTNQIDVTKLKIVNQQNCP